MHFHQHRLEVGLSPCAAVMMCAAALHDPSAGWHLIVAGWPLTQLHYAANTNKGTEGPQAQVAHVQHHAHTM